ncbi:MAG: nuclease [Terriglobia bacterium]
MNKLFKIPPASKADLTPPDQLVDRLRGLIGHPFTLSGKTKTDGSRLRHMLCEVLERYSLPPPSENYIVLPPRGKGVPRIRRELLDSYIATTGLSYNLQVWNRIPAVPSVLVEYVTGDPLLTTDVRFVLVKVDAVRQEIRAVAILTPSYIVRTFGPFGKPTIKHQLIISARARAEVLAGNPPILSHSDHPDVVPMTSVNADLSQHGMHDEPQSKLVLSMGAIISVVEKNIIGKRVEQTATKNRGQALEEIVARALGYRPNVGDLLAAGYPDIRHQGLEVKVQDAPTVDLGRFSPQLSERVPSCPGFTTASIRYLIALTEPATGIIQGAVVCPGIRLGEHFSFVADSSYKCQRTIPMKFFSEHDGQVVFDPQ